MKNPHAQALGRLGKGKTSEAKAAAARRNGTAPVKPGSKPRGRPSKSNVKTVPGSARLAAWHLRQCNGDWEHGHGIKITTYDNPAWGAEIDIEETDAEDALVGTGKVNGMTWEVVMHEGRCQLWGYDEEKCDLEGLLSMLADVLESTEQNDQG